MLTKMKLGNFKSWREMEIDLAPITLLFGTNSSGKTSILHALLLLKQTANSFDRGQHINFGGGDRDYVDFGSYRDLVYEHDERNSVEIALTWSAKAPMIDDYPDEYMFMNYQTLFYEAKWSKFEDQVELQKLVYRGLVTLNDEWETKVEYSKNMDKTFDYVGDEKFNAFVFQPQNPVFVPENAYRLPHEVFMEHKVFNPKNEQEISYILDYRPADYYNGVFEDLIKLLHYLAPLRQSPKRTYLWTGSAPQTILPSGENTVPALIVAQRKGDPLPQQVSEWLVKLGLAQKLNIEAIDQDKRFYRTRIDIDNTSNDLTDVGFGVSQVLPVLTMLFFVPEGSIVLIEQPELHLHPSAQAQLADLFLEVAEKRKLQLIIESHSEHLLRRLQRRIAEPEHAFATTENIKAYFCEPSDDGSKIKPVEINPYGQITNWPANFFGDISGDLEAMMDAGTQRRIEELSASE